MEYWIVAKDEETSEAHRAMGFGIAYAFRSTLAEAYRYQLEAGIRAKTKVIKVDCDD